MKALFLSLLTVTTLLTAAPQAVVFDFGGVMNGEPDREMIAQFLRESFQLSEADFEKINQEKRKAVRDGKTDQEFWLGYAKQQQIELPSNWADTFRSVLKASIRARDEMYQLVDELKEKQLQIALFSNIDHRLAKIIRDFGLYEAFNPCILSCEIGVEKPNVKAYKILVERLNIPPTDIIFIDNKLENVEKAKEIGIDGILFESHEQIRQELKQRELL